ncbi:hypothetical protein EXN66_Car010864 [Channa argus]|uniref:Uncharacterized protein n=1 Tax=Channa argus TaxID=215402 RepID=A0A6G1PYY4_CHAAH|nr:hypothetical protein EXN66_Car010864 [Channa argus]
MQQSLAMFQCHNLSFALQFKNSAAGSIGPQPTGSMKNYQRDIKSHLQGLHDLSPSQISDRGVCIAQNTCLKNITRPFDVNKHFTVTKAPVVRDVKPSVAITPRFSAALESTLSISVA